MFKNQANSSPYTYGKKSPMQRFGLFFVVGGLILVGTIASLALLFRNQDLRNQASGGAYGENTQASIIIQTNSVNAQVNSLNQPKAGTNATQYLNGQREYYNTVCSNGTNYTQECANYDAALDKLQTSTGLQIDEYVYIVMPDNINLANSGSRNDLGVDRLQNQYNSLCQGNSDPDCKTFQNQLQTYSAIKSNSVVAPNSVRNQGR